MLKNCSGGLCSPEKGISLIALIITIVVLIILASITIFNGLGTPNQAGLAKFATEISDVETAVMEKYHDAESQGIIQGKVKSPEQIYYCIANGTPISNAPASPTKSGDVSSLGVLQPEILKGTVYYKINNTDLIPVNKTFYGDNEEHYITNAGEVFILPGYKLKSGNETRWYIDEKRYYVGEEQEIASDTEPQSSIGKLGYYIDDDDRITINFLSNNLKLYVNNLTLEKQEELFVDYEKQYDADYYAEHYPEQEISKELIYESFGYNNLNELSLGEGYSSIADFLIGWNIVEVDILENQINGTITLKHENIVLGSGSVSLGNDFMFTLSESGNYTIEGIVYDGTKVSKDFSYVDTIFKTDGNGKILGLKNKYIDKYTIEDFEFSRSTISTINIPDRIGDEEITEIDVGAFAGMGGIDEVTINNSVINIGENAFSNCTDLRNISLPNGLEAIEEGTFFGCNHLSSITIPNSVSNIGGYAFYQCSSLVTINIPNGVTRIGEFAFYECSSIENVEVPSTITSIDRYSFYNCSGLSSVSIHNGITTIEPYAFCGCSNLENIIIPESVTSLGEYTFFYCTSLESVTLSNNITSLNNRLFGGCSNLSNIIIPNNVTSIGREVFLNCESLTSITIPNGITRLEFATFRGCTSLTNVVLPDGLTYIATDVFGSCTSLRSLYIPVSVVTIIAAQVGNLPFLGCSSSLVLYCGATNKQSGWGQYWDRYTSVDKLTVKYSFTRAQYEAEINN